MSPWYLPATQFLKPPRDLDSRGQVRWVEAGGGEFKASLWGLSLKTSPSAKQIKYVWFSQCVVYGEANAFFVNK